MEVTHTIGRRKTSVARIYLQEGKGAITVNQKDYKNYFPTPTLQYKIEQPFDLTSTTGSYDLKLRLKAVVLMVKQKQFVWPYLGPYVNLMKSIVQLSSLKVY